MLLEVLTSINPDSCTPAEKDAWAAAFGKPFSLLLPGQVCQILVQSRPTEAAAILPELLGRYRPEGLVLQELTESWRAQFPLDIERVQAANRRAYIIVAPPPLDREPGDLRSSREQRDARTRRSLQLTVEEICRHLEAMQVSVRRLTRARVIHVLGTALRPLGAPYTVDADLFAAETEEPQPGVQAKGHAGDLSPAAVEGYCLLRSLTGIGVQESPRHLRLSYEDGTTVYAQSLVLLEPPEFTSPGWLDALIGLPVPHSLSLFTEGLDRRAERRLLTRRRRTLNILHLDASKNGTITNLEADSAQAEATRTALETQDPARRIVKWGVYLTIFAADEQRLELHVERARSLLRTQMLAEVGRGVGHQLPLFRATLPLAVDTADRRFRVRSETLGNSMPFLTHSPGMSKGIPLGFSASHNEMVFLDLDHPGLGNLVMTGLGVTGSGKTQFAQNLTIQVLLLGGRVIVVDKAGHYSRLLGLVGGTAVTFGGEGDGPAINIWDGPLSSRKISFLVDVHEILLCEPGQKLDSLRKAMLSEGIRAVHELGPELLLERDLVAWLHQQAAAGGEDARLYRELAYTLSPYVGDGEHAGLLDRATNVDLENRLVVFDLDPLLPQLQPVVMFVIADRVRRRVVGRRRQRGELITDFFVVDEGWSFLAHAAIAAWLSEVARKSRHWGLAVLFLTQQVSDLTNNQAAKAVFNAASLHFLFRQSDATSEGVSPVAWLRDTLSLSQAETERLYGLATVLREYAECLMIFKSKTSTKAQRGVIQLRYHPWAYWATTSHPHADVPYLNDMIDALGGDVWAAVKACAVGDDVPEPAEPAAASNTLELVG